MTEPHGNSMEWLMEYAAVQRSHLRGCAFFLNLRFTNDRDALGRWLSSLQYFSHRFVQSLMLRAGMCPVDSPFLRTFLKHAMVEADHPEQNWEWRTRHGFPDQDPTQETVDLADSFIYSAMYGGGDKQVVHHAIGGEGAGFDFFTTAIPAMTRLDLNDSPYWEAHLDDAFHMRMGVDLMTPVSPDSLQGLAYRTLLDNTFMGFRKMYDSWFRVAQAG